MEREADCGEDKFYPLDKRVMIEKGDVLLKVMTGKE